MAKKKIGLTNRSYDLTDEAVKALDHYAEKSGKTKYRIVNDAIIKLCNERYGTEFEIEEEPTPGELKQNDFMVI